MSDVDHVFRQMADIQEAPLSEKNKMGDLGHVFRGVADIQEAPLSGASCGYIVLFSLSRKTRAHHKKHHLTNSTFNKYETHQWCFLWYAILASPSFFFIPQEAPLVGLVFIKC